VTAAAEHVHEVTKSNRVMQVGWCVCGEVWDERKEVWVEPKYTEGILRRAAWDEKQQQAERGR